MPERPESGVVDPTPAIEVSEAHSNSTNQWITLGLTVDDLLEELTCPVCYDVCFPPIHNCSNGHSVCGRCRKKILDCPICRLEFRGRNFTAENIVGKIMFRCKNSALGCPVLVSGKSMLPHLDERCPSR